ncbi:MAG: FAD-dependent oxidoreductase [Candidatus Ochrobactrum gambitense]|nr:MAG: FAD-dependent oxidoreductase [Candidatus Ochrobactrum gambitense]WEK15326.1 MAG: FAD-dependent oxidoreductase [Candidatus Ochrobactrum gambitense]
MAAAPGIGIKNDIAIIGAGPVALFAVFQLGLFGFKCQLIDALDRPGGQCTVFYPDKPIFDIPGFPTIMGDELVSRLMEQITPYSPAFHYGQTVTALKRAGERFVLITDKAGSLQADAVVIASGLGAFGPDGQIVRPDPLTELGLERNGNAIAVSPESFATSQPDIYAIGDACHYPGKLKLILSGFHEAALMTQAVRKRLQKAGSL